MTAMVNCRPTAVGERTEPAVLRQTFATRGKLAAQDLQADAINNQVDVGRYEQSHAD